MLPGKSRGLEATRWRMLMNRRQTGDYVTPDVALALELDAIEEVKSREGEEANDRGQAEYAETPDGKLHEEVAEGLREIGKKHDGVTKASGRESGQNRHNEYCATNAAEFGLKVSECCFERLSFKSPLGELWLRSHCTTP
jgi:hypothetical protein